MGHFIPPSTFPLKHALAQQEQTAGADILAARSLRTPYQEETVTERLLLGLARDTRARSLTATAYSKPVEGRTGADWLWSFRGAGGGMTGLLVQAKALTIPQHRYAVGQAASDGARKRAGDPDLTQLQVLLQHATTLALPAAYAFYNDAKSAQFYTRRCPWEDVLGPLGGITLAGARLVEAVVGACEMIYLPATLFSTAAQPLSCALLCQGDHLVGEGADELDVQVRAALRARAGSFGPEPQDDAENEPIGLLQDLYGASRAVLGSDDGEEYLESMVDRLGVAGIVWISQEREAD